MSASNEIILAQEQDVTVKDNIPGKMKNIVGTLLLTEQRVMFVEANKEEDYDIGSGILSKRFSTFRYADVDDLSEITSNPNNIEIPLKSVSSASGSEGLFHPPELRISWKLSGGGEVHAVFTEELIGGRKKDLKNWAKVILGLRDGMIKVQKPSSPAPSIETLEGKVLHILGDMQEKGIFEIEQEIESEFKVNLDPDVVEEACKKLASLGFLDSNPDPSGEVFYRMRSPLGEDDLSS